MRPVLVLAVLMLALALGGPAAADQNDPRLDPLFDRLRTTDDSQEAAAVERRIWLLWLRTDNDEVRRVMRRGMHVMRAGRPGLLQAMTLFDRAIAIAPDYAEAWNKRATVHYMLGDYEQAVRDIAETLALEPRHFGALSGLGLIYLKIGDNDAALKTFEAALELNPHQPGSRAHAEALRERVKGQPT